MKLPRFRITLLSSLAVILAPAASSAAAPATDVMVFFGTRETGPERGFSVAHFNTANGTLSKPQFLVAAIGPSFFQIHPSGKYLYTINTRGSVQQEGLVSAYSLDPKTSQLTLLNSLPSGGINPVYMSLDQSGRFVMLANYVNGTMAVFAIKPDGSLGNRTAFIQDKGPTETPAPHAHSLITDPSNRFAIGCDLGLDRVYLYKFDDKTGTLTPNDPAFVTTKTGSGPRHPVFHPNGKFVYVLCETANTVITYAWDSTKGTLGELQTASTLPAGFTGSSKTADLLVHPNGKFLYASNRGQDGLTVFSINPDTGLLTPVDNVSSQGKTPRNFTLDPSGQWLMASNNDSNTVIIFKVDTQTGKLTPTGSLTDLAAPYCERFLVLPSPAP